MTDVLTGTDCPVMDRTATYWAFAHQVAAYTADPLKSMTMLVDQHAKVCPNDNPVAAEARLRGILRIQAPAPS